MNNPLQNFKNRRSTVLHNQPSFLVRLAELMGEGYTFSEGATLLLPHHVKDYQTVLSMVEADLKGALASLRFFGNWGFQLRHCCQLRLRKWMVSLYVRSKGWRIA